MLCKKKLSRFPLGQTVSLFHGLLEYILRLSKWTLAMPAMPQPKQYSQKYQTTKLQMCHGYMEKLFGHAREHNSDEYSAE